MVVADGWEKIWTIAQIPELQHFTDCFKMQHSQLLCVLPFWFSQLKNWYSYTVRCTKKSEAK